LSFDDVQNKYKFNFEKNLDTSNIDPDTSSQANEFYREFWGKSLSHNLDDYGKESMYRGDTIISFNTIAGGTLRTAGFNKEMPKDAQKRFMCILDPKLNIPLKIVNHFALLYYLYHTPANFMPLPNDEKNNLNKLKFSNYKDFPDAFFKDIKKYEYSETKNDKIPSHFENNNSNQKNNEYFRKFKTWKDFVEKNYLQDFFECEKYKTLIPLKPNCPKFPYIENCYTRKIKSGEINDKTQEYQDEIYKYIDRFLNDANLIILKRGKRLEKYFESSIDYK
jgi:hypothetical protein